MPESWLKDCNGQLCMYLYKTHTPTLECGTRSVIFLALNRSYGLPIQIILRKMIHYVVSKVNANKQNFFQSFFIFWNTTAFKWPPREVLQAVTLSECNDLSTIQFVNITTKCETYFITEENLIEKLPSTDRHLFCSRFW